MHRFLKPFKALSRAIYFIFLNLLKQQSFSKVGVALLKTFAECSGKITYFIPRSYLDSKKPATSTFAFA